ncbi:hypothetical protein P8625_15035 [Tenacibaculum tangerinum]|uniref:Lipoprotein n=1 Tax=Tenacibaculum tangerinum TaxID=3038772 RepID=A0ABY8L1P4_9FLAO|nr:hypothetical protein [Tenacibaculum tangerinum]WGH75367.1 hypothetical protein P8625_15035 [Tenacibaculum tangerinum]
MKHLLLLVTITFALSCCSKDDNDPKEPLPPATQTGAGTFACKVNGQNFIDTSGGYFNCFYQLIDGAYYFGVQGSDEVGMITSLNIGTTNKTITEGEILNLVENIDGNAWAGCRFLLNINSSEFSNTTQLYTGELTITRFDLTNKIVSGTFWFDIKHPTTGATIEIREGRFDTLFTQ